MLNGPIAQGDARVVGDILPSNLRVVATDRPESAANESFDPFVSVTRFAGKGFTKGKRKALRWSKVCDVLAHTKRVHNSVDALPLISFGTFPDNSRAAGNRPERITAVVGDYDAGAVPIEHIVERLRTAGIAACVYTTRRHTPEKPRCRIITPLSRSTSAGDYPLLVDRLNSILGGILARESREPARCYFYGKVRNVEYRCEQTHGACLDDRAAGGGFVPPPSPLPKAAAASGKVPAADSTAQSDEGDFARRLSIEACTEATMDELESALSHLSADNRDEWIEVGIALASLKGTPHEERARELWIDWSMESDRYKDGDEKQWDTFRASTATYKKVFALAQDAGWANPRKKAARAEPTGSPDPIALDWSKLPEEPPELKFLIPGWMPDEVVTLFAAHGGTGKSFMSVYIALCLATGRHPFEKGARIPRVKVVLYSAEDTMTVMHARIVRYMRMLDIRCDDLQGWLLVLDATASDNILFRGGQWTKGRTTDRFTWLEREIRRFGADALIFDNASDAMDANENDRAKVRRFLSLVKRLARAVLLLAHVDANSSMVDIGEAKGYSGSTAWHNSARSRWFMARSKGGEDVVLTLPKVNYAKSGSEAVIRWSDEHKVFEVVSTRTGRPKAADHRGVLLRLLRKAVDSGTHVSPSRNTASSVYNTIKVMDGFPHGLDSTSVGIEVQNWKRGGLVRVEPYQRPNRAWAERVVLTDQGMRICAEDAESDSFLQ